MPYTQKLIYSNAVNYGFTDFQEFKFSGNRVFNASDYIEYIGTHSDHIVLREPYRSDFFSGIKNAILKHGDKIESDDTITVYIAQKP